MSGRGGTSPESELAASARRNGSTTADVFGSSDILDDTAGSAALDDELLEELADLEADSPRRAPRLASWWIRSELPVYLASLLFTVLAAANALHLDTADLRFPFVYSNDAIAVLAHFKTVLDTGWYEFQSMLGAPVGQNYHDFPQADNLAMMFASLLRPFTSNPALAVNVYYLLGFPLAALAAVFFFRRLGVSKVMTLVLSVLFAIAPFHWEKGENHLFLAAYFPVPLALVVVFWIIRGEPVWGFRSGVPRRGWRWLWAAVSGRGMATLLILALLGTASSYFSIFLLLMIGAAGLIAVIRTRNWRRFLAAVLAGATLATVMLLNMLPDILYSMVHGNNVGALVRDDSESERYALKITQLILPAPDHPLLAARQLRAWYDATYPFVSERPALGLIAALGFLGLLGFLLIRLGSIAVSARNELLLSPRQLEFRQTIGYLALLTVVGLLFSTMGGLETIVSFFTDSLRSWNRMSILLAAFALAAVGLSIDALARRVSRRRRGAGGRRLVTGVAALLVLSVGVWDQTTLRAIPAYATIAAQWNADQQWIDQLETALPDGAMVFQLAYQAFPEAASTNGVGYTESLKPFLHSSTLRWSGGGMRGRAENDWNLLVAAEPSPRMVADLAVTGFEGIMIDRRTYVDAGATIEASLNQALGKTGPDMVSATTRYVYYSLSGERDRLHNGQYTEAQLAYAAQTVLEPVFLYMSDDFKLGVNASKQALWTSREPTGALILDNARGAAVSIKLNLVLTSPTNASQVMLTSGSQSWVVNLSAAAASAVTIQFAAPPGRTDFVVSPGPDATNVNGDTTFAIANVSVVDPGRVNLSLGCPANPGADIC